VSSQAIKIAVCEDTDSGRGDFTIAVCEGTDSGKGILAAKYVLWQ